MPFPLHFEVDLTLLEMDLVGEVFPFEVDLVVC